MTADLSTGSTRLKKASSLRPAFCLRSRFGLRWVQGRNNVIEVRMLDEANSYRATAGEGLREKNRRVDCFPYGIEEE